jgi:hypothetical protein
LDTKPFGEGWYLVMGVQRQRAKAEEATFIPWTRVRTTSNFFLFPFFLSSCIFQMEMQHLLS